MKKTLILGLGNPILTDDGVGIHVARVLASRPLPAQATLGEASVGGLRLLEVISGYARVIIVDAIQLPGGKPGQIFKLHPDDLRASRHTGSAHDLTLQGALQLGRKLGMRLPEDKAIKIIAIQAENVLTLGEKCTPGVAASIPLAAEAVLTLLKTEEEFS